MNQIINWLKVATIIIGVIALGMFAVNQGLGYYYKSRFLQTPCELCAELNPQWQNCFEQTTKKVSASPGRAFESLNISMFNGGAGREPIN